LVASVLPDPARFDLDEINRDLIDPLQHMLEHGVHPLVVDVLIGLRGTTIGDDLRLRVMVLATQQSRPRLGPTGCPPDPGPAVLHHHRADSELASRHLPGSPSSSLVTLSSHRSRSDLRRARAG